MQRMICGDCHLCMWAYAEQDAELALKLYDVFMREIYGQDLTSINELEHRVLPVLIDMKMHGVRVDIDEAERANKSY
ncbi:MAG: hypothetical protein CM15mV91_570 [uncultured marine virus]|nr:MAG: hypothetical protein CM15mV91_570 [uncultured marine virus]